MSFDSRLRAEFRRATEGHELREEDALRLVKAVQPAEWADLTVVTLEPAAAPRSKYMRAQRVVGALAACALIAGAIALPVALHARSRTPDTHATAPLAANATCSRPIDKGYRSTVVVRVGESPPVSPPSASSTPFNIKLAEPAQFALGLCDAALTRTHLRSEGTNFDAKTDSSGNMLTLTVVTPSRGGTTALARNWAELFQHARIAAAKQQFHARQRQFSVRIARLHNELRRVDERLVKLMPNVYKNLLKFDAPNGNLPNRGAGAPPPVPEHGSVEALNLAFERIQLLSSLTDTGSKAAELGITVVKPDVFATIVSQTPAVLITSPHHDTSTSKVLLAVGLLVGGVMLAGSAFWLGRRNAMRERAGAAI